MIFSDILKFCIRVLNSIQGFANSVFSVLSYEISLGDNTYSVFTVIFGTGIYLLLTTSIIRFILGLGD